MPKCTVTEGILMALQNAKTHCPAENQPKLVPGVFGGKAFTYICRPNTRTCANRRFNA